MNLQSLVEIKYEAQATTDYIENDFISLTVNEHQSDMQDDEM
jgi:hypothetical protein